MNIAICEDTKTDRNTLLSFVKKYSMDCGIDTDILTFENGETFLKTFEPLKYKIVFLDVYMPGLLGIDVAKNMREKDTDCVIIFTTTSMDHALDSYRVDAMQYLVKPLEYENVKAVLDKCIKLFKDSLRFIEVLSDRLSIKIPLGDIYYIDVYDKACIIHTKAATTKTYRPLDEIEQELGGVPFLRCHRSYLVNMCHVAGIGENAFVLSNGENVPIRRTERLAVKQTYFLYLSAVTRGA